MLLMLDLVGTIKSQNENVLSNMFKNQKMKASTKNVVQELSSRYFIKTKKLGLIRAKLAENIKEIENLNIH